MGEDVVERRRLTRTGVEAFDERARARAAIERLEADRDRWRDRFEVLPDAALVTNVFGVVREANGAAVRLFATKPGALVGRALHALVRYADARSVRDALTEVTKAGSVALTIRLGARAGRAACAVEARAALLPQEGGGVVWTMRRALALDTPSALRTRIASLEAMSAWQTKLIAELTGIDDAGAAPLRRDVVDLDSVIARAVAQLADRTASRSVVVTQRRSNGAATVVGDAQRLGEMIRLLLIDAIEAAPPGGIVPIASHNDSGEIAVSIGSAAPIKTVAGQAIARAIAALHGGTLRARPLDGGGIDVAITFPIEPALEPRYEDAVDQDDFADLSGIRVVVVEDDADAREMLVDVLAAQGAEVRDAGNGADAIDLVASWHPDVLVSDIGLPDMDGYALIRRVRQLGPEHGGALPAIALTGYADIEDSRRALAAGYQVHVAKPIDSSLLTHAVANVAGVPIGDVG